MKNSLKRKLSVALSLVLAFVLIVGATPLSAFAANKEESGKLLNYFNEAVYDYCENAYAYGYQYALDNGYIDEAIAAIDDAVAELDAADAEVDSAIAEIEASMPAGTPDDLPTELPDEIPEEWLEFIPEDMIGENGEIILPDGSGKIENYEDLIANLETMKEDIATLKSVLADLKAVLLNNDAATLDSLVETVYALEGDIYDRLTSITVLWIAMDVDVEAVYEAIEAVQAAQTVLKNDVIPAAKKVAEFVAEKAYGPLIVLMETLLDKEISNADELVAALKEVSGMSESEIKAIVDQLIYDATHEEYDITEDSYYVAFGNTYARNSYVNMLAKKLGVDFKDNSKLGMTIEEMAENVNNYASDIKKADLVTVAFGEVPSLVEVVEKVMLQEADYGVNWAKYLGAGATKVEAKVDAALAELYAELDANGVNGAQAEAIVAAVELYAYKYVVHAVNVEKVAKGIAAINPEALIVVVGAYNPLSDLSYTIEGTTFDFGAYINYLFDAFGVYDLAYAIITEKFTYVNAPEVDVLLNENELSVELAAKLTMNNLMPSEEGHEYIATQIDEALLTDCNHAWGEWTETTPADCDDAAVETRTCSKCGATETREGAAALGHDFGEWIIDSPATETKEGAKHRVCNRCGYNELGVIPVVPPTGDIVVATAMTSTVFAAVAYACVSKRRRFN